MKFLLKPLENFKGTQEQETAFSNALYGEIDKVNFRFRSAQHRSK